MLRDALATAGAPEVPAVAHDDEVLRTVRAPALLDHLAEGWAQWEQAAFPAEYGRDRVVPYVFPTPECWIGRLRPEPHPRQISDWARHRVAVPTGR